MADKTIGGLTEAKISDLPMLPDIYDDAIVPVEFQNEAAHISGAQWKRYAEAAAGKYVDTAYEAAAAAQASAGQAAASAGEAAEHAKDAAAAQHRAETARDGAQEARQAIEDMAVSAVTLPPGSEAAATKTAVGGSFNILFGIPEGQQGAVGPQGADGIQGPPGRDGINGVAVPEAGMYAFNVNEAGHLILSYTGDTAPDFSIREDGHLYLNII